MSEMVDRVAKAMWEQFYTNEWPPTRAADYGMNAESFRAAARVAISAMREPTKGMMDRYLELDAMDDDNPYNPPAAKEAWQAMIDAALDSNPPSPSKTGRA